jgi:hypothetical protein
MHAKNAPILKMSSISSYKTDPGRSDSRGVKVCSARASGCRSVCCARVRDRRRVCLSTHHRPKTAGSVKCKIHTPRDPALKFPSISSHRADPGRWGPKGAHRESQPLSPGMGRGFGWMARRQPRNKNPPSCVCVCVFFFLFFYAATTCLFGCFFCFACFAVCLLKTILFFGIVCHTLLNAGGLVGCTVNARGARIVSIGAWLAGRAGQTVAVI